MARNDYSPGMKNKKRAIKQPFPLFILTAKKEDQTYDRKSARKEPKGLSNHIVAFANADGGTLVIGIEDNGEITGIDGYTDNVNE